MLDQIYHALEKPLRYTKTNIPFWNDEYISHLILREQVKTVLYQSVCRMDSTHHIT